MKLLKNTKMFFLLAAVVAFLFIVLIFSIPTNSGIALADDNSYLTFTANVDNSSVTINYFDAASLYYNKNEEGWVECPSGTKIDLNKWESVSLKGNDLRMCATNGTDGNNLNFAMTGEIIASGDVTSLTNEVGGDVSLSGKAHCYKHMFRNCTSLITAPDLPSTSLVDYCYYEMFIGCTRLTSAPELPAKNLYQSCYHGMFKNCISLPSTPELASTSLGAYCYYEMFRGCKSLTTVSALPATVLVDSCYRVMFCDCDSLTTPPALPSTTLAKACYQDMFAFCDNLEVAPALPATTLTESCYRGMFNNCPKLTETPELPATILGNYCYRQMFSSCTGLTKLSDLPARNMTIDCYFGMFWNCASVTTAPALPATSLAVSCYNQMFRGCVSLIAAPELPATTLANYCYNQMFAECTELVAIASPLKATSLVEGCYASMFNGCTKLNVAEGSGDVLFFTCSNTSAQYCVSSMFSSTSGSFNVDPTETNKYYYNIPDASFVTEPTAKNVSYNGSSRQLVNQGEGLHGTLKYALGTNDISEPSDGWSLDVPKALNAGTYYVWVKVFSDDYYKDISKCITVILEKATPVIDASHMVKSYTYTGKLQTINKGVTLNHNEATIEYTNNSFTDVGTGTYTVTITVKETKNYKAGSLDVEITVKKATTNITVDQTPINSTYGAQIVIPAATSNFGEVTCDKTLDDLKNAGTYTITYQVPESNNYSGAKRTVKVNINKLAVEEPMIVGTYKYTGDEQKLSLLGVDYYMTTSDSLIQKNSGVYKITFLLDDNHIWAEGSDGVITWEIKSTSISSKTNEGEESKQEVIMEIEDGFTSDISIDVDVTEDVETSDKEFEVNYYKLQDEDVKLAFNERVAFVYDVKLYKEINGQLMEIQPGDIKQGATIKVKILIPEDVDVSKISRILHVHSSDDIEEITFDTSKLDQNGYYEITIDRLSEFAFIYEEPGENNMWVIIVPCVVGGVLLISIVITVFVEKKKKRNIASLSDALG